MTTVLEFYEKQGALALHSDNSFFGASSFPLYVSAPYRDMQNTLVLLKKGDGRQPKVLDLCCGTGVHSIYPALLGYRVYGLDISINSIRAARQLADHHAVAHRCSFSVSDVFRTICFDDAVFDCVICSGSMYYLDLTAIIGEIRRVLKPGGQYIGIETYAGNPLMSVFRMGRYRIKKDRDRHTLNHLLGDSDIRYMVGQFTKSDVRFYDCLTLLGALLVRSKRLAVSYHQIARKIDAAVLNRGMRCLAFKFMVIGHKRGQ